MNGYQITFYTQQDRTHGHEPLAHWLLAQVRALGLRGATLSGGLLGLGHDGRLHAVNLFDVGDQPLQITVVVSADEERRLLEHLRGEAVEVFYTRVPIEFGQLGRPQDVLQ